VTRELEALAVAMVSFDAEPAVAVMGGNATVSAFGVLIRPFSRATLAG